MSLFLGFYRPTQSYLEVTQARARSGEGIDPVFRQKVLELPEKLPSACRILGSYNSQSGPVFGDATPPSVMILEADDTSGPFFISQYYSGYLSFQWTPATSVGVSRGERDMAMPQAAQPAGVR